MKNASLLLAIVLILIPSLVLYVHCLLDPQKQATTEGMEGNTALKRSTL